MELLALEIETIVAYKLRKASKVIFSKIISVFTVIFYPIAVSHKDSEIVPIRFHSFLLALEFLTHVRTSLNLIFHLIFLFSL